MLQELINQNGRQFFIKFTVINKKFKMAAHFSQFFLFFTTSLWGKLSQDQRKDKNIFLSSSEEKRFQQILMDPEKDISNFNIITDNLMGITYKCSERTTPMSYKTNEIAASFVSAYGRIMLHDLLMACENSETTRCLYYDTDSIFAVVKNGHEPPFEPDNDELGQLANELDEGERILRWVCLGAKNYCYITNKNKIEVHIRGFTMSIKNVQEKLNFDSMKELLLNNLVNNEEGTITTLDVNKIRRDKNKRRLMTVQENKKYSFRYFKQRLVKETLSVEPYGY